MKNSDVLMGVLKSEGLQIVDEEGFPFESEEQNEERMWYEREAKRQNRRRNKEVMVHRSRGNRFWQETPESSPAGEKWIDPAGGVHYGGEVNFEQYE